MSTIGHSYYNFIISNIIVNLPITKFIEENITHARLSLFFKIIILETILFLNNRDNRDLCLFFKLKF